MKPRGQYDTGIDCLSPTPSVTYNSHFCELGLAWVAASPLLLGELRSERHAPWQAALRKPSAPWKSALRHALLLGKVRSASLLLLGKLRSASPLLLRQLRPSNLSLRIRLWTALECSRLPKKTFQITAENKVLSGTESAAQHFFHRWCLNLQHTLCAEKHV